MKIFSSEFGHNYKKYSFGYANYCLFEKEDRLSDAYSYGYLPYTGSSDISPKNLGGNIFYMARSTRIALDNFLFSSENRRVVRKFDGQFKRLAAPIRKFDITDKNFLSVCAEYFSKRHGPKVMPPERLKVILNSGVISHIVEYSRDNMPMAYVFECSDIKMTHLWFSFYNLNLIHQSLGMWLMLDSARFAKERGVNYFYIGTVYGEKALYKTAFKNLEYWDGGNWISDIKKLKALSRSENDRKVEFIDEIKKDWRGFQFN